MPEKQSKRFQKSKRDNAIIRKKLDKRYKSPSGKGMTAGILFMMGNLSSSFNNVVSNKIDKKKKANKAYLKHSYKVKRRKALKVNPR